MFIFARPACPMEFIFLFIPSGLNLFLLFNRGSKPRKGIRQSSLAEAKGDFFHRSHKKKPADRRAFFVRCYLH